MILFYSYKTDLILRILRTYSLYLILKIIKGVNEMRQNRIREYREKAGLSQTKLACSVGVASGLVSDIELGKRDPWPKLRRALADSLKVSESDLFPEEVSNGSSK